MIRCPDNQINASFIDILTIKWLFFFMLVVFLPQTSTVASSEAPADYQPAPGRTDGVASKTMDYKFVFTNLCLELQQNRSWIKGLSKNPQKSELIHWRQCLLSGGTESRVPSDSEKHRRVYTSSNVCHSHEWRVDTASGKTCVYTASEAKGLRKENK